MGHQVLADGFDKWIGYPVFPPSSQVFETIYTSRGTVPLRGGEEERTCEEVCRMCLMTLLYLATKEKWLGCGK